MLILSGILLLPTPGFAADPYLPSTGPVQTWTIEATALVWEAHLWWGASQGDFEQCDGGNRWLGQEWMVPRPDGKVCVYYSLYWNQRRRLWEIYNALPSYVSCDLLVVMARHVPDPTHPLSCDQLEKDFGPLHAS